MKVIAVIGLIIVALIGGRIIHLLDAIGSVLGEIRANLPDIHFLDEESEKPDSTHFWKEVQVSMNRLARIYERVWLGERYKQPEFATKWAKVCKEVPILAQQGDGEAQMRFADFYANGIGGVSQDDEQAAFWLRAAAEQGHPDAQHNLAFCYNNGRGVQQNYAEAYFWWHLASVCQVDSDRQKNAEAARDHVANHLASDKLLEVMDRASHWLEEHKASLPIT